MELKGKTALITGGAIRLGKAIAIELASQGCNLALHYHRSDSAALELINELKAKGVKVEPFQADLENTLEIPSFVEKVKQAFGQIDILVNNAAIYPKSSAKDVTVEQLEQVMHINLFSPVLLMREFAKQIPADGQGKIVNIIDAGVFRREMDHFAYRLAKIALFEATKLAALEFVPNITVNAVSPGLMMAVAGYEHLDMQAIAERRVPLKRLGGGEVVAQNVVHILEQDFMTGANIVIDGGEYI